MGNADAKAMDNESIKRQSYTSSWVYFFFFIFFLHTWNNPVTILVSFLHIHIVYYVAKIITPSSINVKAWILTSMISSPLTIYIWLWSRIYSNEMRFSYKWVAFLRSGDGVTCGHVGRLEMWNSWEYADNFLENSHVWGNVSEMIENYHLEYTLFCIVYALVNSPASPIDKIRSRKGSKEFQKNHADKTSQNIYSRDKNHTKWTLTKKPYQTQNLE